jgi:pyruvate/2-oxoglutarate/acetoin dehydrogenase E1 component
MGDLSYKDFLIEMNSELARLPNSVFIGYGLKKGRALGTLKHVPEDQIIEMPVAENLMIGFAIGLSLKGFVPVVFIERMDFILNALDAIVNHLDKVKEKSNGEFGPAIIIRCIVGNKHKPLYTGITHTQDHSEALRKMISFPVIQLKDKNEIKRSYESAIESLKNKESTILVEYKDLI